MRSNGISSLEKIAGKGWGHPRANKSQVSFAAKNQG